MQEAAMKVVIPGGTGQIGQLLVGALEAGGHQVWVLTRSPRGPNQIAWDGRGLGDWARVIDGCDLVINLAGRSVDCRYTAENLDQMMRSRVDSTRIVGDAIRAAQKPPALWLQMSTATIYAHRFDADNDESSGIIGGSEPDVPEYWRRSIEIATAWEAALDAAETPHTRKVALRTAMVMTPSHGGVFDVLRRMSRLGLGGSIGGGRQYVSWIHGDDFVRVLSFICARSDLSGAINVAAPGALPQAEFMRALRKAMHVPIGLPATAWMAEIGAFFLRTDTELLLKSRRVRPGRLLDAGFRFGFPAWDSAAGDLVERQRARETPRAWRSYEA